MYTYIYKHTVYQYLLFLSIQLSKTNLFRYLAIYLSLYPSIYLSIHPSIYLSILIYSRHTPALSPVWALTAPFRGP